MSDEPKVSVDDMVSTYARLKGTRERSDDHSAARARLVLTKRSLERELRAAGIDPDRIKPVTSEP